MNVLDTLKGHLPNEYLTLFIANVDDAMTLYYESESIADELINAFDWFLSNEGFDFWHSVYNSVLNNHKLPKIPPKIEWKPNTYLCDDIGIIVKNHNESGDNIEIKDIEQSFKSSNRNAIFLRETHLAFCN